MLEQELDFFIAHQDELVAKYPNKVLVIKDQEVRGVYEDVLNAYLRGQKQYALGSFLIQPCQPGPEAYTATISTLDFSAGV